MGLTTEEPAGMHLPTAAVSREQMLADIPKARRTIEALGASDLMEMLLGEDA